MQLTRIAIGASEPRLARFINPLNEAMAEFAINTIMRQAAFLSQVCHESGSFYILREMASGTEYDGRADLGNIHHGDGQRYKGRGLLKIRNRLMYELVGDALKINLIDFPDLLEVHPHSSRSAAWYWSEFLNLNPLADRGDILRITRRLAGNYLDLAERLDHYERAMRILSMDS